MRSLVDFINEASLTPEDKNINKLYRKFVNEYDQTIGKMLKDNGLLTILSRDQIVSPKRGIFSTKLWKGMLHRVTPQMIKEFDFLQGKSYEFVIPITAGLVDPESKDIKMVPGEFFEIENVGIYVWKDNGSVLPWSEGEKVREDREAYTCYLFLNLKQ